MTAMNNTVGGTRTLEVTVTISVEVASSNAGTAMVNLNNAEIYVGDEQASIVGWETTSVDEIEA